MSRGGRVSIVGAGPGAPDLITVRGARRLAEADVIVYDRLVDPSLLDLAPRHAERIYAGKAPGRHAMTQEEINRLLVERASRGLHVVRLKGGDPLFYGRGEEECLHVLRAGIPCEIIPGVPSPHGAAAEHLLPLAGRGYSSTLAYTTAVQAGGTPMPASRIEALARAADTLVVLMGASRLVEVLEAAGRARPREYAAIVEAATTGRSRLHLARIEEILSSPPRVEPPALIIVGGAARWRAENAPYY